MHRRIVESLDDEGRLAAGRPGCTAHRQARRRRVGLDALPERLHFAPTLVRRKHESRRTTTARPLGRDGRLRPADLELEKPLSLSAARRAGSPGQRPPPSRRARLGRRARAPPSRHGICVSPSPLPREARERLRCFEYPVASTAAGIQRAHRCRYSRQRAPALAPPLRASLAFSWRTPRVSSFTAARARSQRAPDSTARTSTTRSAPRGRNGPSSTMAAKLTSCTIATAENTGRSLAAGSGCRG